MTTFDSKIRFVAMALVIALAATVETRAQCPGTWSQDFGSFELVAPANALLGYDDGTGNALYVGMAYGGQVSGQWQPTTVLRWDGARALNPVGNIGDGGVEKLVALNDGTALYAGGAIASAGGAATKGVARWNGAAWSAVGGGLSNAVSALASFDDGAGLRTRPSRSMAAGARASG